MLHPWPRRLSLFLQQNKASRKVPLSVGWYKLWLLLGYWFIFDIVREQILSRKCFHQNKESFYIWKCSIGHLVLLLMLFFTTSMCQSDNFWQLWATRSFNFPNTKRKKTFFQAALDFFWGRHNLFFSFKQKIFSRQLHREDHCFIGTSADVTYGVTLPVHFQWK